MDFGALLLVLVGISVGQPEEPGHKQGIVGLKQPDFKRLFTGLSGIRSLGSLGEPGSLIRLGRCIEMNIKPGRGLRKGGAPVSRRIIPGQLFDQARGLALATAIHPADLIHRVVDKLHSQADGLAFRPGRFYSRTKTI